MHPPHRSAPAHGLASADHAAHPTTVSPFDPPGAAYFGTAPTAYRPVYAGEPQDRYPAQDTPLVPGAPTAQPVSVVYTPPERRVASPRGTKRGHSAALSLALFFIFWMVAAGLFLLLYMDRYLF